MVPDICSSHVRGDSYWSLTDQRNSDVLDGHVVLPSSAPRDPK